VRFTITVRRKNRTFVKLNCAAIPTGLFESELFGHEKGALPGAISQKIGRLELADQGTLFLDEVATCRWRFSRSFCVHCRNANSSGWAARARRKLTYGSVAATNRNLEEMIADREFRSDLYYRLNVFPIRIPPYVSVVKTFQCWLATSPRSFAQQMQKPIETIRQRR
jgi:formate hydrogenlyase transcriptional activator